MGSIPAYGELRAQVHYKQPALPIKSRFGCLAAPSLSMRRVYRGERFASILVAVFNINIAATLPQLIKRTFIDHVLPLS